MEAAGAEHKSEGGRKDRAIATDLQDSVYGDGAGIKLRGVLLTQLAWLLRLAFRIGHVVQRRSFALNEQINHNQL